MPLLPDNRHAVVPAWGLLGASTLGSAPYCVGSVRVTARIGCGQGVRTPRRLAARPLRSSRRPPGGTAFGADHPRDRYGPEAPGVLGLPAWASRPLPADDGLPVRGGLRLRARAVDGPRDSPLVRKRNFRVDRG